MYEFWLSLHQYRLNKEDPRTTLNIAEAKVGVSCIMAAPVY